MTREFSAGGIVFNDKGQVLLVQTKSFRSFEQNGHALYWGFPKGHVETGQTMKEAALREVLEEGGVKAEIIDKVGDSKYIYTRDGEKIFKVVTIFLMRYISGDHKDHDWEVSEASWFNPEEALEKLTFPMDREHLKKALKIYDRK